MNPMQFIIERVFEMSQRAFSREIGVAQPTVHGWVDKGYCHYEHQVKIRGLAKKRGLPWDDKWFFTVPANWEKPNGRKRKGHRLSECSKAD